MKISKNDTRILRHFALNGPQKRSHIARDCPAIKERTVDSRCDHMLRHGLLVTISQYIPGDKLKSGLFYHLTVVGLAHYIAAHEHDFIADYHRVLSHWKHLIHTYDHWSIAENQLHLIAQARTCVTSFPFNDTLPHDLYASL